MGTPSTQQGSTTSLALERLVTAGRRRAWMRDIVWFQIDELNSLYDPLRSRAARRDGEKIQRAKARVAAVARASRWKADIYFEHALAFVKAGLERPEDAFGPAVLLVSLRGEHPDVRRWTRDLPKSVQTLLVELGILDAGTR